MVIASIARQSQGIASRALLLAQLFLCIIDCSEVVDKTLKRTQERRVKIYDFFSVGMAPALETDLV